MNIKKSLKILGKKHIFLSLAGFLVFETPVIHWYHHKDHTIGKLSVAST